MENCHNYHHTLLHVEGDPKIEGTKKVSMDMTYAAPSKKCEKVLLMTCRVKVMAPYTCRTLLDGAASTSLITERLAKKLYYPGSHKMKGTEHMLFCVTTRHTSGHARNRGVTLITRA